MLNRRSNAEIWSALTSVEFKIESYYELFSKTFFLVSFTLLITVCSVAPFQMLYFSGKYSYLFPMESFARGGGIISFLLFSIFGIIVTITILLLISHPTFTWLSVFISVSFGISTGILASIFIPVWLAYFFIVFKISLPLLTFWKVLGNVAIIGVFTLIVAINHTSKFNRLRNGILVLFSGWVGAISTFNSFLSLVILIGVFLIYDILILKGFFEESIKKTLQQETLAKRGAAVTIGLGDLVFYSIAIGSTWIFFDHIRFIASILVGIGILGGTFLTMHLLSHAKEEHSVLPALPIPMFTTLLIMGILWSITLI
ncbi:MAG: hypothetical protein GWO20_19450 [Candidatus Korarchaeota archaeon]|nr:hypothetical protein [Candidatus Korarchaeota archaeon]NIU83654.1 hypothetical protein [Candidatus Thorarchaeota archaeon]NIW15529.1 hypothetical protein [Candidatus Thorarchaeota archaeon]NIW53475.1 hypothetical protein [Candidatus Korarchaeota archaeon]